MTIRVHKPNKILCLATLCAAFATCSRAQVSKADGEVVPQARLSLVNRTDCGLTVKVMNAATSRLYQSVDIPPHDTAAVDISRNGRYFTKVRATCDDWRPDYRRTGTVQFQCDAQGYTNAEMTFTMVASVHDSDGNVMERTVSARITKFSVISRVPDDDGLIHGKSISASDFLRD